MQTLIYCLRSLDMDFFPPVKDVDGLPEEIRALYSDHDGHAPGPVPFRLLPVEEARSVTTMLRKQSLTVEQAIFWTDDHGSYAGLYLAGMLKGKIFFLDQEAPEHTPVYRTVGAFLQHLFDAVPLGLTWRQMERDYPVVEEAPEDEPLADHYYKEMDCEDRALAIQPALTYMALLPPHRAPELIYLLDLPSEEDAIRKRACEILGLRKVEKAVYALSREGAEGQFQARLAAIEALGNIGSPKALSELLEIPAEGIESYIAGALERCGCTVHQEDGKWRYRQHDDAEFQTL